MSGALDEHPTDREVPVDSRILPKGTVLGRLYRIERLIGSGAQGEVYEVEHQHMRTRFAVKVLRREYAEDPEFMARLMREAQTASQIDHPNIARVVNFDRTDEGLAFVVMELLLGESLASAIARGPMNVAETCAIGAEVASALQAAHVRGVTHRDIKPANIFLAETSLGRAGKVMDFGIAKVSREREDVKLTRTGYLVGTPAYMAPEQIAGAAEIDHRTDVYALGAVLFEMLTGRPPFLAERVLDVLMQHVRDPAPDIRRFRTDVPFKLSAIVMRCLEKDPARRFQSMDELAAELQGVPVAASSPRRASDAHAALRTHQRTPHAGPAHDPLPLPMDALTPVAPRAPARGPTPVAMRLPDSSEHAEQEAWRYVKTAAVIVACGIVWAVISRFASFTPAKNVIAQEPPPPSEVTLTLHSDPIGSDVFVDHRFVGITPLKHKTAPGKKPLTITFKSSGYEARSLEIVPDEDKFETVLLSLALDTARPADDRDRAPRYDTYDGRQIAKSEPDTGTVTIKTCPKVRVFIDDVDQGTTPLHKHHVTPGKHVIRFQGRKGDKLTRTINVEANVEEQLTQKLEWDGYSYTDYEDTGMQCSSYYDRSYRYDGAYDRGYERSY
jgi:serine/threonine protein kinase